MRIFGEDSIDAKEEGRCKQVSTADGVATARAKTRAPTFGFNRTSTLPNRRHWDNSPCVRSNRSEERRVGKSVDLGGRRIIKKKKRRNKNEKNNSTEKKNTITELYIRV